MGQMREVLIHPDTAEAAELFVDKSDYFDSVDRVVDQLARQQMILLLEEAENDTAPQEDR